MIFAISLLPSTNRFYISLSDIKIFIPQSRVQSEVVNYGRGQSVLKRGGFANQEHALAGPIKEFTRGALIYQLPIE